MREVLGILLIAGAYWLAVHTNADQAIERQIDILAGIEPKESGK